MKFAKSVIKRNIERNASSGSKIKSHTTTRRPTFISSSLSPPSSPNRASVKIKSNKVGDAPSSSVLVDEISKEIYTKDEAPTLTLPTATDKLYPLLLIKSASAGSDAEAVGTLVGTAGAIVATSEKTFTSHAEFREDNATGKVLVNTGGRKVSVARGASSYNDKKISKTGSNNDLKSGKITASSTATTKKTGGSFAKSFDQLAATTRITAILISVCSFFILIEAIAIVMIGLGYYTKS